MENSVKKEDHFQKWMSALTPLYGKREAKNMWRWYEEASRPPEGFLEDLKRLANHFPIQYLTGYTYFYGDKYLVNKETLIPRPETEELVFKILEDHPDDSKPLQVVDLGTGTGCIPIALKKRRPAWKVSGIDLYNPTLEAARKNGKLHNVTLEWKQQDMLSMEASFFKDIDILISNPPYIPPDEKALMGDNVLKYEPHSALFTQDDIGLEFYIAIATYGQKLKPGAQIYLEIHEHSSQKIIALFDDSKVFKPPKVTRDMQGKNRILDTIRI